MSNQSEHLKYVPRIQLPVNLDMTHIRLDIGCGTKGLQKNNGFIGLDVRDLGQEIVWDVDNGIPLPNRTVKEIFMHHVLEHVRDPIFVLNECWRVLHRDGEVEIVVPYYKESGAYVLHHTHFFSRKTFEHLEISDLWDRYGIRQWKILELEVGEDKWIDDYGEPTLHCIMTPAL